MKLDLMEVMDPIHALSALHAGGLVEAVVKPAEDANEWVLVFVTPSGEQLVYRGLAGTEKVYHTLDHGREATQRIGFCTMRVEEEF